jgi:V/A-type H+-transporting ATPase subunit I
VGLAGSAIASSFNSMAIPAEGLGSIGASFVLRVFSMVLILIFGHTLNMLMNALSVIVHGVRLNLLEYAGNHLSMEWSGYAYKPFALPQNKE